jgi:hypothetical protein
MLKIIARLNCGKHTPWQDVLKDRPLLNKHYEIPALSFEITEMDSTLREKKKTIAIENILREIKCR